MADIEVFYQEIRRSLPKCDDPSMQDAILRATRIFCQKTWYVRRQCTFVCEVPGTPTGVTAVPGNAQATLSWNPVPNAIYYIINQSTVSGEEVPLMNNILQSGAVVPNLMNGQQYFWTVQAMNGVGDSIASLEVSAIPNSANANIPAGGTPTVAIYSQSLGLPAGEEPIAVRKAQCAVFPLAPATAADMDPKYPIGRPRGYAYAPIGNLLLYPTPDSAYQILAMVITQPVSGSLNIADEIAQNYLEGIGYGALKWLYTMKETPWFDKDGAVAMASMFDDEIQRAKREALAGFQAGNLRVQPAPFIIRSIW